MWRRRAQIERQRTGLCRRKDDDANRVFQVAAQGQTVPLSVVDSGTYSKTADVVSFTSADQKVGRLAGSIQNGDLKVSIDLVGDGYPPTYLFRK